MSTEPPIKRDIHKSYAELLEDERWVKFSEGVKYRKGYQCENCGQTEHLVVHHLGYKVRRLPWEYEDDEVMVVCRIPCHEDIHRFADALWNEVLQCRNMWVIHECVKAVKEVIRKNNPPPHNRNVYPDDLPPL